jgi:uncharacterized membrane protein
MAIKHSVGNAIQTPERLEAFSDGVLAIIITIMVLEIQSPGGRMLSDWRPEIPRIIAYLASFIFLAIYWNNHHQLLRATKKISGGVMWANMHLLFWLSLVPAVTSWIGEEGHYSYAAPVALYGGVALMAAVAYSVLVLLIKRLEPNDTIIVRIGKDKKGNISLVLYFLGILLASLVWPILGIICYAAVSIMWLVPDRRLLKANPKRRGAKLR